MGRKLPDNKRQELIELLQRNPYQYVAQEEIGFSSVPYFENGKVEPRMAVIRTFCLKKEDGYSVMNGGLVRVAAHKDHRNNFV